MTPCCRRLWGSVRSLRKYAASSGTTHPLDSRCGQLLHPQRTWGFSGGRNGACSARSHGILRCSDGRRSVLGGIYGPYPVLCRQLFIDTWLVGWPVSVCV